MSLVNTETCSALETLRATTGLPRPDRKLDVSVTRKLEKLRKVLYIEVATLLSAFTAITSRGSMITSMTSEKF